MTFALLLNLVSASNAHDRGVLWGFISRHAKGVTPETHPELDRLTDYAIRYFDDFVKPTKVYRAPDAVERETLAALSEALGGLPAGADGDAIQNAALNVARKIERYQDHSKQSPEGRTRRVGRLLPDDLPGADRPGARSALRLLRCALRYSRDARADRQGARGTAGA